MWMKHNLMLGIAIFDISYITFCHNIKRWTIKVFKKPKKFNFLVLKSILVFSKISFPSVSIFVLCGNEQIQEKTFLRAQSTSQWMFSHSHIPGQQMQIEEKREGGWREENLGGRGGGLLNYSEFFNKSVTIIKC